MTILPHIATLLFDLTPTKNQPGCYDLTLNHYDLITTRDAVALFDARPDMDILFVYFRTQSGRELNVCFQRHFLACKPVAERGDYVGLLDNSPDPS